MQTHFLPRSCLSHSPYSGNELAVVAQKSIEMIAITHGSMACPPSMGSLQEWGDTDCTAARAGVCSQGPAARWLLVRLMGSLLHLRRLVRVITLHPPPSSPSHFHLLLHSPYYFVLKTMVPFSARIFLACLVRLLGSLLYL